MDDATLLRRYLKENSQEAFAGLVRRYTNLVYSTCLRELHDAALAEEAAQVVFLILARRGRSLRNPAVLSSWLFQTAVFAAKNLRRQEQRRHQREQKAAMSMTTTEPTPSHETQELEILLNAALGALSAQEQSLLIQRFWEDASLAEIGQLLEIAEDAARMRVNRAIEKLRRYFASHGVTFSVSALAALLPLAVHPAPAHCAESIIHLAQSPGSVPAEPSYVTAQGVLTAMNLNRLKLQVGVTALIVACSIGGVGAALYYAKSMPVTLSEAVPQAQPGAQAVLNQMYATYLAMHSFKCLVTSREDVLGTAQDAEYEIERPNKIRFHRNTLLGGDLSGQALAVSDGTSLYVTCTENHGRSDRYAKYTNSPGFFGSFGGIPAWGNDPEAGMPGAALGIRYDSFNDSQLSAPAYSLGTPTTIDFSGIASPVLVDVVTCKRHWLTPVGTIKNDPVVITWYIGHADHLLYEVTAAYMFSPTQWDTRTETINGMEIDSKIDPKDFVFTPPPGSREVEGEDELFSENRVTSGSR